MTEILKQLYGPEVVFKRFSEWKSEAEFDSRFGRPTTSKSD